MRLTDLVPEATTEVSSPEATTEVPPPVDTPTVEDIQLIGLEIVFGLGLGLLLAGTIGFTLLRAASKRADAMVTVAVSMLTMVAIVGFLLTQQEALVTLAGAGIGALAGAVTNLLGKSMRPDPSEPDTSGFSPPPDSLSDEPSEEG